LGQLCRKLVDKTDIPIVVSISGTGMTPEDVANCGARGILVDAV
jgi:hypothetical protein